VNTEFNGLISRRGLLQVGAGLLLSAGLSPAPVMAGSNEYRIVAAPTRARLAGSAHPETAVWAYNGIVPGPLVPPALMPELRFSDGEGRPLSLADFRGEVVLLNIWATWCVPCRKEMPTLDRLQTALGGTRFEVVALSIDRGDADAVRKYVETGIQRLAVRVDSSSQVGFALRRLACRQHC
jgi:thiol-disulfide isomerase/thioredoxin